MVGFEKIARRFGVCSLGCLLGVVFPSSMMAQGIPGDPDPQVLVGTLSGGASVDNTGSASYNLSLNVPPGTSGMQPTLGISYNSRSGNGAIGVGFTLSGLSSISRIAPSRMHEGFVGGVEFNADDRLALDGQRLLLVSTNSNYGADGTEYRTELDSFSRVILHGEMDASNCWFEVRTKSGLIYEYGKTTDSFVEPSNRGQALSWAINRVSDTAGNYMDFVYTEDVQNGDHLLERIDYTGNTTEGLLPYNTVDFVYTNRPDTRYRYHKGARFNSTKRLERIEFHVEGNLSHEYRLEYIQGETGLSQLTSVQEFFSNGDSVPATAFEWTDADGSAGFIADPALALPVEITGTDGKDKGVRFMDLNADGLIDLVYHNGTVGGAYLNTGTNWIVASAYAPPFGIVDEGKKDRITFSDINGDGLPDMFYNHLDGATTNSGAYLNTGIGWSTNTPAFIPPLVISYEGEEYTGVDLVDFNADGIADLYYHRFRNYVPEHKKWLGSPDGWQQTTLYSAFQSVNDGGTDSGSRFLDVDGNRSVDELYAGEQWFSFCRPANPAGGSIVIGGPYNPPYDFIDDSDKNTGVQLLDVNGDGLPDFLFHHKLADGTVTNGAYLNTGTGWATNSDTNFVPPIILKQDNAIAKGVVFADVNGDGLVDMLRNNTTSSDAWINSGTNWVQNNLYAPPQPIVASDGKDKGSRFVDINGDGLIDQVYHCGTTQGAWINQSRPPMLKKIVTGQRDGGKYASITELFYRSLTDIDVYTKGSGAAFPTYDYQGSMKVVSEMAKDDGFGGHYWSIYTYANGRIHRDRGFLGFQIIESYDPQNHLSQIKHLAQDFPLTGAQLKTETRYIPDPDNDPDGQLLKKVENVWLYDLVWPGYSLGNDASLYPLFIYAPKSTERIWELGNTNDLVSEVVSYNWFDGQNISNSTPNLVQYTNSFPAKIEYGNITKIIIDYGGGTKQISQNNYLADDANWLLSRLNQSSTTHIRAGCSNITRTASFDYYNGTGFLRWETTAPGSGKWLKTNYLYDGFGNITNKSVSGADIVSRTVQSSVYDSKGRFVTESKNALNHSESIVTDPITGLVESRTGPNSLPTAWQYDPLGRPKLETRADTTQTTTTYAWETGVFISIPTSLGGSNIVMEAVYSVTTQSSGTAPAKSYFDHQGREIRQVTKSPDGRDIYRDTGYNAFGQVIAVSDPYFSGDSSPKFGFKQYDELGRPKLAIAPDGTKTAYGYAGLVSSVTNNYGATDGAAESRNQVTTTYKNAKGEVLKVVDNKGYEINYEYDAAGNLVKTIDELNNEVVMEYDIRGNKIRQDDPDMGEWFYAYNALGELTSQTNANLQVTSMEYDLLGRRVKRIEPEGVAQWFYDNPGEGGKLGALWREELTDATGTNLVFRRTHAYDTLKRPLLSLQNVDGKWFYTCNTYDEFSRVKSNFRFWRPQSVIASGDNLSSDWNSFETINTYNSRGAITKVSDGTGHVWWEIDEANFDAKGHLLEYTLGNGVATSHQYDADTGFIEEIEISNTANGIATYGFQQDRLGNLTQRSLARTLKPTLSESFTYDELNRLRTATVGSTVESTTYDAIGNIQTKSGVSGTYQYGAGNAGSHAVSSANGITYTYDNCGNMLGRIQGGTNINSTVWTSFNKVSTLYNWSNGSEFTYGIDHQRITQISFNNGAGTKKLYLGGFEQTETLTGGTQYDRANWQWTHQETRVFVSTPSGVIGIHVQDAAENVTRKYLHRDHLGSIVAVSGEATSGLAPILAEYAYDSWGKRRDSDTWLPAAFSTASLQTDRGYTGHEMLDSLGLVHMNGRIYDSTLGRFLSADPVVQAPGDLQSYNRYSYVRNNPLTLTDPSGYSWWGDHVTQWGRDARDFVHQYWKAIVVTVIAVVVTVVTFGLASGPMAGIASGVWGSVLTGAVAGAAGGFAAGFSGTLLYGGSLSDAFKNGLTGAAWGALAGAVGGYINAAAWGALCTALAHGVTGSAISLAQGGSWETGFLAGFGAGVVAGWDNANIALKAIAAALVGGTASVMGGGKFANGAVTGAFSSLAWSILGNAGTRQKIWNGIKRMWQKTTSWNFEIRNARNSVYEKNWTQEKIEAHIDAMRGKSEWAKMPASQAVDHQDTTTARGRLGEEIKYIHKSGAELVFYQDGTLVQNQHRGTFNYINAVPIDAVNWYNPFSIGKFSILGVGHGVVDWGAFHVLGLER